MALDGALTAALCGAALCLVALAAVGALWAAAGVTVVLGAAGGIAWVAGYTLLQQQVTEEFRGRTFVLLTVSARVALLVSRVIFPLLAGAFGSVALLEALPGLAVDGTRFAFVAAALLLAVGAALSRFGRGTR